MNVKTYKDMHIELLQRTKYPAETVAIALSLTMNNHEEYVPPLLTNKLGKYLLDADHTSPIEHVHYTFLLQGLSRSFLAQITRHRMGSFTSASQHYQDYRDYPYVVIDEDPNYSVAFNNAHAAYRALIDKGVPKEEARQVLPNAAAVNLLWSVNARGLVSFLKQRLCYRNVAEMQMFAERVLSLVKPTFPEVFNFVGPQCYMDGKCKQGRLKCDEGPWKN